MQTRKDKHVRVRLDLIQWIEEEIGKGEFWNLSHVIEVALLEFKKKRES
jgi:Arc/MetJ-type ribon-helix-helix transcriptional regulator